MQEEEYRGAGRNTNKNMTNIGPSESIGPMFCFWMGYISYKLNRKNVQN